MATPTQPSTSAPALPVGQPFGRTLARWLTETVTPRTLLLTAVFATINGLFIRAEQDPDFWWHIRVGEWIVQHAAIPRHDIFTFTVPQSHLWTDHEYLTEVLMWLAYRHLGMGAVITAFAALTWLGFWFIYKTARGGRQPYVIVGLLIALGALAGAPIWGPRPQMVTFLLSCVELYWLRLYLDGRSRAIYFLPLLMIVWANTHAGWVAAFPFLGAALGAEAVHFLRDRESFEHRQRLTHLGVVTLLALVAVGITPHGLSAYLYPFNTQGSVAQQALINEWQSPNFHFTEMRFYEAMVFLLLVGFAARRPSLYELLLSIGVLAMSLESVRHVALFIAATTPILITTWGAVYRDVQERVPSWLRSGGKPSPVLGAVALVALAVVLGATFYKVDGDIHRQRAVTEAQFPVGAANFLAAHPELGTRMYNSYGWGGYLAYRFYPQADRKVFIFGEGDLVGDRLLEQYNDVQTLQPNWSTVLKEYRVDYVVFNRGAPLDNVLAGLPTWKKVYSDRVAVIYVRVAPSPVAG